MNRTPMDLSGKNAVITGAATGIGRETARLFARQGARVVIADINEEGGREAVQLIADDGGDALFLRTDILREEQMAELMERSASELGGIDVIFNNAGIQLSGDVTEFYVSDWDLLLSGIPR